jgi:Tol biopolymer transport system component
MKALLTLLIPLLLIASAGVALANEPWQLTFGGGMQPAWSPDGSMIAFASDRSGNWDIWVIPASGGVATQVTTAPAHDWTPTWSPDGNMIAFSRGDHSWEGDIWVIPAGGGVATQFTTDGGIQPDWSPDGSMIAFHSDDRIFVKALSGGDAVQVPMPGPSAYVNPDWSPDMSRFACVERGGPGFGVVGTVVCSGGPFEPLTDGFPCFDRCPAWSPDGRLIAFTWCAIESPCFIDVVDVQTRDVTRIEIAWSGMEYFWHPAWSPDGSMIAFSSGFPVDRDIWIIDVSTVPVEPTTWGAIKGAFR